MSGHSLGGHNALFRTSFDPRIKKDGVASAGLVDALLGAKRKLVAAP